MECQEALRKLGRQVHDAHGSTTCCEDTSKNYSHIETALQPPVHPELRLLQIDTVGYYKL